MRKLIVPVVTTVAALVAGDRLLGWYGHRHFVPEQQLQTALAAGDGCILILGDSRMAAGLDEATLHQALSRRGADRCIANLAIGATDVSGAFLAARRYLSGGRHPGVAVLAKVDDSLLDPDPDHTGPRMMFGNNALHLVWTTPGDVFAEVNGFPFASVAAFDDGFRFLISRATALGRYQSLVSVRVQRMQDRLTGADRGSQNRFGQFADMAALERDLRERAEARLTAATKDPGARTAWFDRLVHLLRSQGARIVVVEMPMPAAYRRRISESAPAVDYCRSFTASLAARGATYIDLGHAPWVDDTLFGDPLHLNAAGAVHFSRDLGDELSRGAR
jgi:hypothetical protein